LQIYRFKPFSLNFNDEVFESVITQTSGFSYRLLLTRFFGIIQSDFKFYFNLHSLMTLEYRIILTINPYQFVSNELLVNYLADQFLITPGRRTQRWYIADVGKLSLWIVYISRLPTIRNLNIVGFEGIETAIKGRAADQRRVFPRRFSINNRKISKLESPIHYVTTYSQKALTTHWGSTNIIINYNYNPFYRLNKPLHKPGYINFRQYGRFVIPKEIAQPYRYKLFTFMFKKRKLAIEHFLHLHHKRKQELDNYILFVWKSRNLRQIVYNVENKEFDYKIIKHDRTDRLKKPNKKYLISAGRL
jgi:hypothetical protein